MTRVLQSALASIILLAALSAVVAAGESKSSPPSRDSAAQLFAKGNDLYVEAKRLIAEGRGDAAKAKFGEAEVAYQRILDGGFVNWQVLYNLGNALYQQGALGRAAVCYRRAERLAPREADIRINLEKVKAEARDKEMMPVVPGYVRTLLFPYYKLSLEEAGIAAMLSYTSFGVALFVLVFVRGVWTKLVCATVFTVSIALGASVAAKVFFQELKQHGAIVAEASTVRFGPGPEYETRFVAHDGAELVVLSRHRDQKTGHEWLKVRVFIEIKKSKGGEAESSPSAAGGWVEARDVELF